MQYRRQTQRRFSMEVRGPGLCPVPVAGCIHNVCPTRVLAWEPDFRGSNPSTAPIQLCDLEQVSQALHTSLLVLKWSSWRLSKLIYTKCTEQSWCIARARQFDCCSCDPYAWAQVNEKQTYRITASVGISFYRWLYYSPERGRNLLRSHSSPCVFAYVSEHISEAAPRLGSQPVVWPCWACLPSKARPWGKGEGPTARGNGEQMLVSLSLPGHCRTSVRGSLCPWTFVYPRNSCRSYSWRVQTCPNRSAACPAEHPW